MFPAYFTVTRDDIRSRVMEPRAPRSNDALAQLVLDSLRPRPASLGRGEVVARLLRKAQRPGLVLLHLRPPELLDHVRPLNPVPARHLVLVIGSDALIVLVRADRFPHEAPFEPRVRRACATCRTTNAGPTPEFWTPSAMRP